MKLPRITLATVLMSFAAVAIAGHHTIQQLTTMNKDQLIQLVIALEQTNSIEESEYAPSQHCQTFDPLDVEVKTQVLSRVVNSSSQSNGTLNWPNGKAFLLRNGSSYNNQTIYYNNGQVLRLNNSSSYQNGTLYWPNGKVMRLNNSSAHDNRSIYRYDGSACFINNPSSQQNQTRVGLPIENLRSENLEIRANIIEDNKLKAAIKQTGDGWTITIFLEEGKPIKVKECVIQ